MCSIMRAGLVDAQMNDYQMYFLVFMATPLLCNTDRSYVRMSRGFEQSSTQIVVFCIMSAIYFVVQWLFS